MKRLSAYLMRVMSTFLPEDEETGWEHRVIQAKNGIAKALLVYRELGYERVTFLTQDEIGDVAYIANANGDRLRLVEASRDEYDVWIVRHRECLISFKTAIHPGDVTIIYEEDTDDCQTIVFRLNESSEVVQLVWRRVPIFTNVFMHATALQTETA